MHLAMCEHLNKYFFQNQGQRIFPWHNMRHCQAGKIPQCKEGQPACSQPIVRRKTRPKPNVRHQAAEKLRSLETPAAGIQAVAEQCDAES